MDNNNKPLSWKDLGYNDRMEKPARTDDAQAKRQGEFEDDLRKQQKHQAEMQVLKKKLNTPLQDGQRWCRYDYESKTFQITQNNGQILALTFRPFDGKVSGQTILFEVGYELWKNGATQIPRTEIITRCSIKATQYNLNQITIDSNWLKQTRKNLRTTIGESQVVGLIEVFEIEQSKNSYRFSIKRPQE